AALCGCVGSLVIGVENLGGRPVGRKGNVDRDDFLRIAVDRLNADRNLRRQARWFGWSTQALEPFGGPSGWAPAQWSREEGHDDKKGASWFIAEHCFLSLGFRMAHGQLLPHPFRGEVIAII
ncbi:hypothetical protein WDW86_11580, partial [Bdellovibrionota bacterium FG-2]